MRVVIKQKIITLVLSLAMLAVFSGCAANKSKEPQLSVAVTASKELNTYNNKPHTLVLVVYQLADPSAFNQMLVDPDGQGVLLEGKQFDKTVLHNMRLVVQPGDDNIERLGLKDGTQYLGIVAGYYNNNKKGHSLVIPLKDKQASFFWAKGRKKKADVELLLDKVKIALPKEG